MRKESCRGPSCSKKNQGRRYLGLDARRFFTPKAKKWEPPLMDEDWVVLCQALYQLIGEEEWPKMHERFEEACRKTRAKKAGQRIAGLRKV